MFWGVEQTVKEWLARQTGTTQTQKKDFAAWLLSKLNFT